MQYCQFKFPFSRFLFSALGKQVRGQRFLFFDGRYTFFVIFPCFFAPLHSLHPPPYHCISRCTLLSLLIPALPPPLCFSPPHSLSLPSSFPLFFLSYIHSHSLTHTHDAPSVFPSLMAYSEESLPLTLTHTHGVEPRVTTNSIIYTSVRCHVTTSETFLCSFSLTPTLNLSLSLAHTHTLSLSLSLLLSPSLSLSLLAQINNISSLTNQ